MDLKPKHFVIGVVIILAILLIWSSSFITETFRHAFGLSKINVVLYVGDYVHPRLYHSWRKLSNSIKHTPSLQNHIDMKISITSDMKGAYPVIHRFSGGTNSYYTLKNPVDYEQYNITSFVLYNVVESSKFLNFSPMTKSGAEPISLADLEIKPRPVDDIRATGPARGQFGAIPSEPFGTQLH